MGFYLKEEGSPTQDGVMGLNEYDFESQKRSDLLDQTGNAEQTDYEQNQGRFRIKDEGGKAQEPVTFKGAAGSYLTGLAGGAGGLAPDIAALTDEIPAPLRALPQFIGIDKANELFKLLGFKTTPELTESISQSFNIEEPQNALERILQQSGEFGGMEGLVGTAAGGLPGAGAGLAHGSISGALYGGLKELGLDDNAALITTGILSLSPVAARKFLKNRSSKAASKPKPLSKGGGEPPPSPPSGPETIEQMAISEKIPSSERGGFEKAQNILKSLQEERDGIIRPSSQPVEAEESIQGRVSKGEDLDLGLRPSPQNVRPSPENLEEIILGKVSPQEIYNKSQTGEGLKNNILEINDEVYRGVGELYDKSRELNQNITAVHPELESNLRQRINELKKIPAKGEVTNKIIKKSEELLNRIGTPSGLRPITNQELIDQVQELREIVDFEFLEGKVKNKFRPLIRDISDAVEKTAITSGAEEAVESWKDASNAYRTWVDYFDNPEVNPYRKRSNRNYESLYNSSLNSDNFNALKPILDQSEKGQTLSQAIQREIAMKELEPFFKDPKNINKKKLDRSLRDLESTIDPPIVEEIRETLDNYQKRFPNKLRVMDFGETASKAEKAAAKLINLTPEQLESKFKTRTGIQEVRDALSKTPAQQKQFNALRDEKVLDLLRQGEIEKKLTGQDLYKVLNNTQKNELLTEMLGKEEVEKLRLIAQELGEKEANKEQLKKIAKTFAGYKVFKILLSL